MIDSASNLLKEEREFLTFLPTVSLIYLFTITGEQTTLYFAILSGFWPALFVNEKQMPDGTYLSLTGRILEKILSTIWTICYVYSFVYYWDNMNSSDTIFVSLFVSKILLAFLLLLPVDYLYVYRPD